MRPENFKRSVLRIAGIAAIAIALLTAGGAASAAPREVGLTACDRDGCTIVTMHDLVLKRSSTQPPAHSAIPAGPIGFTE